MGQATPIRAAISVQYPGANAERTWHVPNKATRPSKRLRKPKREAKTINGSESTQTAHAYAVIRMPACDSLTWKSAAISTSNAMGMNSDVLNTNAENAIPMSGSSSFALMPFFMCYLSSATVSQRCTPTALSSLSLSMKDVPTDSKAAAIMV